jgi:diamine N-acetyltransferase
VLRGQKVQLRPVKRSDVDYFLVWFNDPEVIQYLNMYLPMTEMYEENYIQEFYKDYTKVRLVIEAVEGQSVKPIGSIGLDSINPKDHNATFGIAIGEKDYWSKGYGTEATRLLVNYGFEQLNLHRINSSVFSFNERSLRMHKKVGFKEEGRQREYVFKNGRYHDHILLGILKSEWKGL